MQNRIVIFDLDGTIYQNSVFHRGYLRTLVAGTWAEPLEADLVRLAEAIFAGRKLDMNRFYRRGRAEAATVPELVQALRKRVLPNMTYAEALQADDVVYLGDAWAVLAYLGDALGCLDGDRANEVYRLTRLQMEQAGMHGDRGLYEAIMRLEQRCRVVLLSNSYEETVREFLRQLGFADVVEVAVGADICTIEEAHDFLEKVPNEQRFMATSCCPSWRMMARRLFPAESGNISMTYTPMVYTARLVKKEHPNSKVVFIGPCAAKKLEAMQEELRQDVDFVLTYEELMGIFEAKEINFSALPDSPDLDEGTRAGRGFAVAGGVAAAVEELIHKEHPDIELKTQRADGLRDCRKLLMLAKAGKLDGYLLEGMACPGGCVAGAGTVVSADTAAKKLAQHMAQASGETAKDSKYRDLADQLN